MALVPLYGARYSVLEYGPGTSPKIAQPDTEQLGRAEFAPAGTFKTNGYTSRSKKQGFLKSTKTPKVFCKVFEDNSAALQMANIHKYRPRTKHLNVKLHHFRQYVNKGIVKVFPIKSEDQQADYLTKPLKYELLIKLRKLVMGW